MAGVAIGDGHELHVVAHLSEQGGGAGRADVAIIGMRSEGNDAELAVGILGQQHGGADKGQQGNF